MEVARESSATVIYVTSSLGLDRRGPKWAVMAANTNMDFSSFGCGVEDNGQRLRVFLQLLIDIDLSIIVSTL